ncbi:MAG: hypothetical protein HC815_22790 [Richelia sp. RM1_1_1]|nr:hypothetical protein [Richelia sp. RM1_1_1]
MFQGIPYGLEKQCEKLKSQPILNCTMIQTKAIQPGLYTFKIIALLKEAQNNSEITKATEVIKIQPKPPQSPKPATPIKITSFKINGQEVSSNPKQTFAINKQRTDASIALSWQVEKGEDIKVELLPAPGVVSTQGFIDKYPLGNPPNNEIITLKVTNKAGEATIKSVVIQTVESNQNQSSSNSNNGSGANTSGFQRSSPGTDSTTPLNSGKLSPIELPPTAD